MRLSFLFFIALSLFGCASGFEQFYSAARVVPPTKDIETLPENYTPIVYSSDNLQRDIKVAMSKNYWPVGESNFNGELENIAAVVKQARRVNAAMAIVNSKFTGTQTSTVPLFLPNNQTTYSSGSIYTPAGGAVYSGSSTTYGSTVVPLTTSQRRFDQSAVYFVKLNIKYRFGLRLIDIPSEDRIRLERNTGAYIDIVFEKTPAFYANIIPGDLLISVDGIQINSSQDASEIMKTACPNGGICPLVVLRNGSERKIDVSVEKI